MYTYEDYNNEFKKIKETCSNYIEEYISDEEKDGYDIEIILCQRLINIIDRVDISKEEVKPISDFLEQIQNWLHILNNYNQTIELELEVCALYGIVSFLSYDLGLQFRYDLEKNRNTVFGSLYGLQGDI